MTRVCVYNTGEFRRRTISAGCIVRRKAATALVLVWKGGYFGCPREPLLSVCVGREYIHIVKGCGWILRAECVADAIWCWSGCRFFGWVDLQRFCRAWIWACVVFIKSVSCTCLFLPLWLACWKYFFFRAFSWRNSREWKIMYINRKIATPLIFTLKLYTVGLCLYYTRTIDSKSFVNGLRNWKKAKVWPMILPLFLSDKAEGFHKRIVAITCPFVLNYSTLEFLLIIRTLLTQNWTKAVFARVYSLMKIYKTNTVRQ